MINFKQVTSQPKQKDPLMDQVNEMILPIASAVIGFGRDPDKTPFLQLIFYRDISSRQIQHEITDRLARAEPNMGSNTFRIEDHTLQIYPNGAAEMSLYDFFVRARHIMTYLPNGTEVSDPPRQNEVKDLTLSDNVTDFREWPST